VRPDDGGISLHGHRLPRGGGDVGDPVLGVGADRFDYRGDVATLGKFI
jgi:hypothetical protein